jgi:4-amino-4-deoxy-L-arabinose transferase-like glycosyltransferase
MSQRVRVGAPAAPARSVASPGDPYRALKQFGLAMLCAVWVVLGLVGHDPWKTEDAVSFGVVHEMMQDRVSVAPRLTGEPFFERPPLVYAFAAVTAIAFSPPLAAHDAARLAAGILIALTLLALAATATELCGADLRWVVVLLFVGSVGLWDRSHQLSAELGLVLGVALGLRALALALRRPIAGGAMLGAGIAVGFLARGLPGPIWLGLAALALPAAFPAWRNRQYALTLATAFAVALAGAGIWLGVLALRAPDHLAGWWAAQRLTDLAAARDWGDLLFLPKNLPWFAWPALPLVLWTLWTRGRGFNGGLAVPAVQIPGTLAVVMFAAIALGGDPRAIIVMPILLPLALLGALEVDSLPRGLSGFLDWFGILTFGLAAALMWWLWFDAHAHGMSAFVAKLFRDTETGYRPPLQWLPMALSVLLTLGWFALVRPARRSNRRAVLNWTAGMTLLWALYSTLWLPYLDSRRSYRDVAQTMRAHLPAGGCIASRNLGDAQRALFRYFAGVVTVREEVSPRHDCGALLVQYGRIWGEPPAPAGWQPAWSGSRRGDDTERYVLYLRKPV